MDMPSKRLLEILKLMLDKYFKIYYGYDGLCKVINNLKTHELITEAESTFIFFQLATRTGYELDTLSLKYVWPKEDAAPRMFFLSAWIKEVESKLNN